MLASSSDPTGAQSCLSTGGSGGTHVSDVLESVRAGADGEGGHLSSEGIVREVPAFAVDHHNNSGTHNVSGPDDKKS
jgi:hypothetical protein